MVRGTRYLLGEDAARLKWMESLLTGICERWGYEPFIPSALASQETFTKSLGPDLVDQMYTFPDKKGRELCLVPEITRVAQQLYQDEWQNRPKPIRLYYFTRCYRYERPQAGRYREFWQFGIEMLGKPNRDEVTSILLDCLSSVGINYEYEDSVTRGLGYYIEDGFEVNVPTLGAQKQIAGGGSYPDGTGWAIGVDRLLIAWSQKMEQFDDSLEDLLDDEPPLAGV